MRLRAIVATVVSVVGVVAFSGANVFADTASTNNAGNNPAQNFVTVQSGDYLAAIAAKNNTTYVRIYDANQQVQDPDLIYPGEVLRIPAANEQLPDRQLPSVVSQAPVQAPVQTSDETDTSAAVATPAPAEPAAPVVAQQTVSQAPAISSGSVWDELAQCESSGDWSIDTGNGFYGGLQFTLSSWEAVGGTGYPNQASRDEQILRAELLQARQGWGAWPVCSAKLGL